MPGTFEVTEKDKIRILSLDQDDIAPHSHNYLELVYITAGKGIHDLNGVKTVVKKGNYFIIEIGRASCRERV